MKKTILTIACGFISLSLLGQGTMNFQNGTGNAVSNILTGLRAVGGTTFSVALYYLPDQADAPSTADFDTRGEMLGAKGNIAGTAANPSGVFIAGTRSTPATTPGGGQAWFQVRAWETAYGQTWQAAIGAPAQGGRLALAGTSNIFKVATGNPSSVPPGTPGSLNGVGGMVGFFMVPVPEPSVIGLGLLGVGALLVLRRRK